MRTLFAKTFVLMVALFGAIASAASLLSAFELRASLYDEYRSKAAALATSIAESHLDLLIVGQLARLQSILDQYLETPGVAYVYVEDERGEIVAHTFVPGVPGELYGFRGASRGVMFSEVEVEGVGPTLHASAPILEGVAGFAHVGMDLGLVQERIWSAVGRVQIVIFAIFLASVLIGGLLVRRISGPLRDFAGYARRLGRVDEESLERDEITIRTPALQQRDEIGVLARSFVDMEHQLRDSIRRLREETAARERLESELKIAREIQRSILPRDVPAEVAAGRLDLQAHMTPAREVGGDFYDFFPGRNGRFYFAVGDVSGKGVPASLFMAVTATLLRAAARESEDPAEVLSSVNLELCRENDTSMFVTLFLGVLELQTGRVSYCNGGHNPPYVLGSGGARQVVEGGGVLLGCFDTIEYRRFELRLQPGEALFLYTDGVTEAFNASQEMFGEERLEGVLREMSQRPCADVSRSVLHAVETFVAGALPSDDVTILSLRYLEG